MKVSPRCLEPLLDANGKRIQNGQTVELKLGSRPYRRLHTVQVHPAGFLKFVREDGGYIYHARKNKSKTGYQSRGRFPWEDWQISA